MKISLHIEADSLEGFLQELASLRQIPLDQSPAKVVAEVAKIAQTPEPEPEPQVEQPAAAEAPAETPQEPAQPRRGRPRKSAAPVEPAAADTDAPAEAEPAVVKDEPAPAKVKTMPHAKPENGAATRQDLLDVFSEYVQRYGASFGFSDISSLLQKNLGDGVRKASDVPEDKLQVAIGAIKTAIADNPFNRKRDYA